MKSQAASTRIVLLLVITFSCMMSCQNSKKSNSLDPRPVTRGQGSAPVPQGFESQNGTTQFYYTQAVGRIYTEAQYRSQFNSTIIKLLSATMEADEIGEIDAQTGVELRGYVEVDTNGQIIAGPSLIEITVKDSFVGDKLADGSTIKPIVIRVPARSGSANNGRAQLRFEDSHGSISLVGTFDNQTKKLTGTISFQNTNGHSGQNLGFEIETCGFFRCQ